MSRKKKLIMSLQSPRLFTLKRLQGVTAKILKTRVRFQATAAASAIDPKWESAKPFNTIPGPKPLPIPCGNFWRFMRFGPYANLNFIQTHKRLAKEYGPILRMTGVGREDVVYLYDPEYIETMFRNEGVRPIIDFVQSFPQYMAKRNSDLFKYGTILFDQGEKWKNNRSSVHHIAMPTHAMIYSEPIDQLADIFVNRMKSLKNSNSEMPEDFENEISKCALETVTNYTLDMRLGCLERNGNSELDAARLITAIQTLMPLTNDLDMRFSPPVWKYISTPGWRKFVKASDTITSICSKLVHMKIEEIKIRMITKNYQPNSLLEALYLEDKSSKLATFMAVAFIFGGTGPVGNAISSSLYQLSKNPDKQEKLYQELKKVLPNKESPITSQTLNELKYLKACIKESMRIQPSGFGMQRRATKDYVIGHYRIPKGTSVIALHHVPSNDEKHFKSPDTFTPERWLRSAQDLGLTTKEFSPFAFLPFGFGPRKCVGQRFAQLELEVIIAKIFRNFRIEYNYGDITWTFDGVYKCNKPLQYKIEDRVN